MIEDCYTSFKWELIKKHEKHFILLLLNALNDDQDEIKNEGVERLERVSRNRKLLFEQYQN